MKMIIRLIFLFLLLTSFTNIQVQAQNQKKKTTRLSVDYFKDFDLVEKLVATMRVREDRYEPLTDVIINFYNINDTSRVLLESIRTNMDGKAIFIIDGKAKIVKDTSGALNFEVEYEGNTEISSSSKGISLRQANLSISFVKIDTIKSIEVTVSEQGLEGAAIPIEDINVSFYIKGTFSLYNIGKGKTNEKGVINVGFPDYMPGDTAGVMTIVAKVEDDRAYGNIEVRDQINWGIPVPLSEVERRGLGDTDAPLWMVYTLIILLSAVWFHYLYVIFLIIRIKLARNG